MKGILCASIALAAALGASAQVTTSSTSSVRVNKLPPGVAVRQVQTAAGMRQFAILPNGSEVPLEEFLQQQDAQDAPPVAAAPENAAPSAPAPGDAAIAPYLQMQPFPRQAKDVLQALADGPPPAPAAEAPEPAKLAHAALVLRWRLIAGDWAGVAKDIEALPADGSRGKVFDHVRRLLAPPNVALSADEVVAVIDASPVAPEPAHLREFGALFARAGQTSGMPTATLQRIRAGTRYLGGAAAETRLAAARLLIAAGMPAEAQPYLPSLDDAKANGNAAVLLLHAEALQHSAAKSGKSALDAAFALVAEVLAAEKLDDETRDGALRLSLALIDDPSGHRGDAWLRTLLTSRTDLGRRLLAALAAKLEESAQQQIAEPRLAVLRVAENCGRALVELPSETAAAYGHALETLTAMWLLEAGHAIYPDGNVGNDAAPSSPAWFERAQLQQMLQERRKKNVQAAGAEALLALAPKDAWLARLDGDVAERVRRHEGLLASSAQLENRAIALVEREAARNQPLARELVDVYLASWTRKLGQRPSFGYDDYSYGSSMVRYSGGGPYYNYGNVPPGVPMTRARQGRNLDDLARLSQRFEALGFPFKDVDLAEAFGAAHSAAEVYRPEDLERVFGEPTQLSPGLAVQLVNDMRQKLAGQWRKPSTQQQAQTNRTNKEIVVEVTRGYEFARELLEQVEQTFPSDRGLQSLIGVLLYDQAEFLYGQKVDLKVYIALRDAAFEHLKRGAELYREGLEEGREEQVSAEAFRLWFNAAMGASDLAYLTRQEKPDLDQVAAVGASIRALPAGRVDEHMEAFGEALANGSRQVPPQLKPHYFRQALRVIGSTKSAKQIEDTLRSYDELETELELQWEIDGSAKVGFGREFGVLLALRHTRSIDRETGGFQKYLSNKQWSPRTGQQVDYRDLLEKSVRERIADTFEVKSLLPFDPQMGKLGDERYGWERTPLFYFVLAAKDPAVDRLPSVTMDVDFNDPWGYVLLPIEAKEVAIDARANDVPTRPAAKVEVTQTFDDRKLEKERVLRVEVRASGRGVLPPLERLVDKTPPRGFRLDQVLDQGLTLTGVDMEDGLAVLSERSGVLEFKLADSGEPSREIAFPKVLLADAATKYQRFADADVKQVDSVVLLRELSFLSPERWGLWALIGGAIVALAAGLWYWQRRLRLAATQVVRARYAPLREASAFGAVALLRRLSADPACTWDEMEQRELASDIEHIQREHFAPNAPLPSDELVLRVNRWIERA